MEVLSFAESSLPFAAMVMVEFTDVGVSTISKAAMSRGMSNFVFIVYHNALGTLINLPYFIYRRKKRAPLTFSLIRVFFLLGLMGTLSQLLSYTGIKYSSPTLALAISNLIPVFTFLLAVIFRMEKLDFRRSSSQAKSLGTIITISGALIITLYRGQALLSASPASDSPHQFLFQQPSNWVLGGILLTIAYLVVSTWNIVQAATVKKYPEEMTIVFFCCFFVTIQSSVVAFIMERNPHAWKLKPDIEMVTIGFSAIFGNVFRFGVHVWCTLEKGPVYVAMFKPLGIVIAAVAGVTFLGDTLHLGSIIGAIVIVFGIYAVMWGKAKEEDSVGDIEASTTHKTPLLQSSSKEETQR